MLILYLLMYLRSRSNIQVSNLVNSVLRRVDTACLFCRWENCLTNKEDTPRNNSHKDLSDNFSFVCVCSLLFVLKFLYLNWAQKHPMIRRRFVWSFLLCADVLIWSKVKSSSYKMWPSVLKSFKHCLKE